MKKSKPIKTAKNKREPPLHIPLPFDTIVTGMLQVKPDPKKPAAKKGGKK